MTISYPSFNLQRAIRYIILGGSIFLILALYIASHGASNGTLTKLVRDYGLLAALMLYLSLLITPLLGAFPSLPYKGIFIQSRRSLGVSAFVFALAHGYFAFFYELDGFAGLPFLSNQYLLAIILSATALLIMLLLAATSLDIAVRYLGKKWKLLHRFVYPAGLLVLIHVLLLGTDFSNTATPLYRVCFLLVALLLGLEAIRIDKWFAKHGLNVGAGMMLVIVISFFSFALAGFDQAGGSLISVHAGHIQEAQQAQTVAATSIPGLVGDRTKRYSVSFDHDATVVPNQPTTLYFKITDAATGAPVTEFTKIYTQFIHLIAVDDTLTQFQHLHPTFENGEFAMTMTFPTSGNYHIYLNFQPYLAIEQAFAFSLPVGTTQSAVDPTVVADTATVKTVDGYTVQLVTPRQMSSADVSVGKAPITIYVTQNGKPVTTLSQYLGAFGHLTLVNTQTFEFLHVHPLLIPSSTSEVGGPNVTFTPLGLYGPVSPGTYRGFFEIEPNGQLLTTEFTFTFK